MTPAELMAIDPIELAAISDEELGQRLSPLFPIVRMPYAGPREKIITLPNGIRTTKKGMDRTAQMLQQLITSTQARAQPDQPTDVIMPPTSLKFQTKPFDTR